MVLCCLHPRHVVVNTLFDMAPGRHSQRCGKKRWFLRSLQKYDCCCMLWFYAESDCLSNGEVRASEREKVVLLFLFNGVQIFPEFFYKDPCILPCGCKVRLCDAFLYKCRNVFSSGEEESLLFLHRKDHSDFDH